MNGTWRQKNLLTPPVLQKWHHLLASFSDQHLPTFSYAAWGHGMSWLTWSIKLCLSLVLCSTAPLPLCSGVLWELGPWRPGSSREGCQRGQCILKNNTQPLKPPGTKLCNNWLVQPCDLITVSQGFQRKLKGVKHPLDPASDHLKSSPFSFVLLSSCFTFARGGISPWAPGRPGSLPDLFVHTRRVGLGCWPVSLCPGFPCSLELRQPRSSSSKSLV